MHDYSRVRVSVVIPARDAEAMIGRTVAAVRAQELDGAFEVIVVDDGSTDRTRLVAEEAGARVVRNATPAGPADARNAGVAAATAPLIAFTDADCVPAPGWLRAGLDALEDADLVQGRVEPEPGVPVGPFDHVISVGAETGLYETANLFVARAWFDRVGGFRPFMDPAAGHFGEDLVFGWAVRRAGGRLAFAADALVHHEVIARPASAWIRERRRLRLFPMATREVPELRGRYFLKIFLSRRTALFDLAVVALLAAVVLRRPALALLALPYARVRFERYGRIERWIVMRNLALVAGDAVGLAALAAGSVSARRLVL
jgi:glycosyltransferase involved in cell wall biosynthesis